MESKPVANMKGLGSDKTGFCAWHEKLVNIMEQLSPGCRGILKALVRYVDQKEDEYLYDWIQNTDEYDKLDDPEKMWRISMRTYMLYYLTRQRPKR